MYKLPDGRLMLSYWQFCKDNLLVEQSVNSITQILRGFFCETRKEPIYVHRGVEVGQNSRLHVFKISFLEEESMF